MVCLYLLYVVMLRLNSTKSYNYIFSAMIICTPMFLSKWSFWIDMTCVNMYNKNSRVIPSSFKMLMTAMWFGSRRETGSSSGMLSSS